ncbi:MAG: DNA polymerase I, partial [Chitinophagaceae bacterium]
INDVSQVIDILGLMGDTVDNIPGIPGIGEKTAAKLIKEYHSIENILANADNIKGAVGEKVRKGKDMAIMSKKLATIVVDIPVEFHESDFEKKEMNREAIIDIFTQLEFKTMAKRILGEDLQIPTVAKPAQMDLFGNEVKADKAKESSDEILTIPAPVLQADKHIGNTAHDYVLADNDEAIGKMVGELMRHNEISFDTETTGLDANQASLVGMSFCIEKSKGYYIPCPADREVTKRYISLVQPLFDREDVTWVGHNLKYDLLIMKRHGAIFKGELFDTMLAHYVIEPDGKRNMDLLSEMFLGYTPISIEELIGKKGKGQGNMRDVEIEKAKEYAVEDADITLQLKEAFMPHLRLKGVEKVFHEVENPLVKVLTDMEFEGIRIDVPFLLNYS